MVVSDRMTLPGSQYWLLIGRDRGVEIEAFLLIMRMPLACAAILVVIGHVVSLLFVSDYMQYLSELRAASIAQSRRGSYIHLLSEEGSCPENTFKIRSH
jgi:hypothetical protein